MRIDDLFRNNSRQMHTNTLAFLEKYGDEVITSISVFRRPLSREIHKTANILTSGIFVKKLKQAGHTHIYHTGLVVNGMYLFEKWLDVGIRILPDASQYEYYPVTLADSSISLRQFYMNGIQQYGDAIWKYDICDNNCQKVVLQLLDANHLMNESIRKFIFQDILGVLSSLERRTITNMFKLPFHLANKPGLVQLL